MYLVLRTRILDGTYPRNSQLTGERALAAEFKVARVTVRSALEGLERDGLVLRRQGRGTVVTGPLPEAEAGPPRELDSFDVLFESIQSIGLRSKVRVLGLQTVESPALVASALRIPATTPVCRVTRVRLIYQRPMSYSVAWMNADIAAGLTRRELAVRPILVWLQRQGLRVEQADETVSACAADIDAADALDVPVGSPLLSVHRIYLDRHAKPLLLFEGRFRPERYRYRMQLAREPRSARIQVVTDGQ